MPSASRSTNFLKTQPLTLDPKPRLYGGNLTETSGTCC
ncbi:hypothetical protein SAMN05877809_105269 [Rhodobacter sp. JA431]|nr:hypothetical protein SAMN05877809_105269 [Rhodobacter sp. JA431]